MGFTSSDEFTDERGLVNANCYYTIKATFQLVKQNNIYKLTSRLHCYKSKDEYDDNLKSIKYTNYQYEITEAQTHTDLIAYVYNQIKSAFNNAVDDL